MDTPESSSGKPKFDLRTLQSLPDCSFKRPVHVEPTVVELPHLYVVGGEHDIEDNVVFLPVMPPRPDAA